MLAKKQFRFTLACAAFIWSTFVLANVTTITADELLARSLSENTPLILDVRTRSEYRAGHVPGAINIPHRQLTARLNELSKDRDIVVYCESGKRAGVAEQALIDAGFKRLFHLQGDMAQWRAEGRPAEQ